MAHGIDAVAKERLSEESGLSRASMDRYFTNKYDCFLDRHET